MGRLRFCRIILAPSFLNRVPWLYFRRRHKRLKKVVGFSLLSFLAALVLTILSLKHMDYSLVWDEAAQAFWGFPFEMIYSNPFYGAFDGSALRDGGREYVLQSVKLVGISSKIEWTSVALNLTCYSIPSFVLIAVTSAARDRIRYRRANRPPTKHAPDI